MNAGWFYLVCLLLLSSTLFGQPGEGHLIDFNLQRIDHQRTAMLVLGGWAVGNIALGAGLRGRHTGSERYFHDMNMYWNVVNLGIASLGYFTALREDPTAYDAFTTASKHFSFQKILLFNAGLDVGYMLGGLYLQERAKRGGERADQLKGFGKSLVLQGGFLMAFDLANYFISAKSDSQLKLLLNAGESGLGLSLIF